MGELHSVLRLLRWRARLLFASLVRVTGPTTRSEKDKSGLASILGATFVCRGNRKVRSASGKSRVRLEESYKCTGCQSKKVDGVNKGYNTE